MEKNTITVTLIRKEDGGSTASISIHPEMKVTDISIAIQALEDSIMEAMQAKCSRERISKADFKKKGDSWTMNDLTQ